MVHLLVKAGADVEAGALPPLISATTAGHVEIMKCLLENGAYADVTTTSGDSSLICACRKGNTKIAEILLQYGATLVRNISRFSGLLPIFVHLQLMHLEACMCKVYLGLLPSTSR